MTLLNLKKYFASSENDENLNTWQKLLSNNFYRIILGALVGAGIGFLYWEFIGCNSGTCPLTSNPYKTVAIFTFMGALYAKKDKKQKVDIK